MSKPRAHPRWDVVAVVGAGGALGSLARWGVASGGTRHDGFPWATFIENVSGCFALGLVIVLAVEVWPPSRYLRPFLGVGVLGGYTTYSTYMLDARALVTDGRPWQAAGYIVGTVVLGLVAVWLGMMLARTAIAAASGRGERARRHLPRRDP